MIDLHIHTNMSDGSDTPFELLEKVVSVGCDVFSVTDHDDLRANSIILSEIKSKNCAAKFITGCEISSVFEGRNLHLLCYGFDPEAESIKTMIAEGVRLRRLRITAMFEHLRKKHGIVISEEAQAEILSRAIPGKVHISDVILKMRDDLTRREIFKNYLDDMESREFKLTAERVIAAVTAGGGVISFAHPIEVQGEYKIDFAEIDVMTKQLKNVGLTAVEVYHSLHGKLEVFEYKRIAAECGLLVSGGSDYHGKNKDVKIGQVNSYWCVPQDGEITITSIL